MAEVKGAKQVPSLQKFSSAAVTNQLRHCGREIAKNSNQDIQPELSHLNYDLTPDHGGLRPLDYYRQRLSEVYCYGRSDVKTMAGWVVTLPAEIEAGTQEELSFFRATTTFLSERYGRENVVQSIVHHDEGVRDASGQLRAGRPHLHFCFIPVVADNNPRHVQSEKVCANDLLTKRELSQAQRDLQAYLTENGIEGRIITGGTGQNRTVEQLKAITRLELEVERLRETNRDLQSRIYDLELELERSRSIEIDRGFTW